MAEKNTISSRLMFNNLTKLTKVLKRKAQKNFFELFCIKK